MRHGWWQITILAGMVALGGGTARAASLTQQVLPYRQRAEKLAAQKQWDGALKAISDAKVFVRIETRREVTVKKPKIDRRFYEEVGALRKEFAARAKSEPKDPAHRNQLKAQYQFRYAALSRKYHLDDPAKAAAAGFGAQLTRQAQSRLLLASLDDTAAGYFAKKGDHARAAASREDAALGRFRAYVTLKQAPQAEHAADVLLKMQPTNPQAYLETAEYYQTQQKWGRAAQIWETGITKLRSGQARPRVANRPGAAQSTLALMLSRFQKEQAFCQQQLGTAPARKATSLRGGGKASTLGSRTVARKA